MGPENIAVIGVGPDIPGRIAPDPSGLYRAIPREGIFIGCKIARCQGLGVGLAAIRVDQIVKRPRGIVDQPFLYDDPALDDEYPVALVLAGEAGMDIVAQAPLGATKRAADPGRRFRERPA